MEWREVFPLWGVKHVLVAYSDHLAISMKQPVDSPDQCNQKVFRFEAMWTSFDKCKQVIDEAWNGESRFLGLQLVMKKIKSCGGEIAVLE